jgi:hypothetical protein
VWRGRILCSKDKLRYIGYLVKDFTSLWSSFTKYKYFGFRLASKDKDSTCRHSKSIKNYWLLVISQEGTIQKTKIKNTSTI